MAHSEDAIIVSHFFEAQKRSHRLERIENLEDLAKIELCAVDGYYHKTNTRKRPIKDKRRKTKR